MPFWGHFGYLLVPFWTRWASFDVFLGSLGRSEPAEGFGSVLDTIKCKKRSFCTPIWVPF